jgi:hypothetical protein
MQERWVSFTIFLLVQGIHYHRTCQLIIFLTEILCSAVASFRVSMLKQQCIKFYFLNSTFTVIKKSPLTSSSEKLKVVFLVAIIFLRLLVPQLCVLLCAQPASDGQYLTEHCILAIRAAGKHLLLGMETAIK